MIVKPFFLLCFAGLLTATSPVGATELAFPGIEYTPQEKAYLATVGSVKMCVDPDWTPFERINKQGQHEGIAADLIQLIAQRVGINIELYPVKNWDESLAASKAGRCQIMSFLNQTPARSKWLNFTAPIFFDQNIIITREEHPFIGDPHGLQDETIALPRGTMVEERIRRDFPNLKVILTASEQESVELVSERKADITIRSLIVAAYAIKKEGLFNLKIAGQIPEYTNQLRIGVIKQEPLLRDILDKGVMTLTAQEREAIANKHVAIQIQRGTDYTLVWQIMLGGAISLLIVLYWVRKLSSLNKQLERLSITDRLTGLFNRVKLDVEFESELQRSMRFGQPFSIILIDIDHFKQVNDVHGHQIGDQILIDIAKILTVNTRETDTIGRWGGEEFLVICPQTDAAGVAKLAETLRRKMEQHVFPVIENKTASFGVTTYRPGYQQKDMVSRADAALYAAKRDGRNRVEVQA
jgi:diguanylate cyclase (GGDEF)-like protein